MGRLLITLFLVERGRLPQPLLYLSDYIERTRQDYYAALQRVRTQGDWRGWLIYFLTGVEITGKQTTAQARALIALREQYRRQFAGRVRALALIEVLLENPYVTARRAATALSVTFPTAQREIMALAQAGILHEGPRYAWGRVWLAQEILSALSNAPLARDTVSGE